MAGKEMAKRGAEEVEKAGIKAIGTAVAPEAAPIVNAVAENRTARKLITGVVFITPIVFLAAILIGIAVVMAVIDVFGKGGFFGRPSLSGNPYDSPFDCNVEFPTGADEQKMAAYIDSIIPSGSPLRGLGKNFVSTAKAGNKNPLFIAHFAQKESSWGTAGIATNGYHNPFGRTAGSGQPSAGKWLVFSSWEEAVNAQGPYLKGRYQDKGLKSITQIITAYCPPFNSEGKPECDTQGYIAEARAFISTHTQKANGAFGIDPCTAVNLAGAGGPHSGSMTWPVPGYYHIYSPYHDPTRNDHNGIDISPVPRGTNVVAAADGIVEDVFVNEAINGYGVRLNHQNGIKTAYLHFVPGSTAVALGQSVKAGQVIGKINSTGRSTGNHLHFAVQVNNNWVNPCGGFVKC